jgi:hypothetical protein
LTDSGKQELADVNEFAKKITACKETQTDSDFQVKKNFLSLVLTNDERLWRE